MQIESNTKLHWSELPGNKYLKKIEPAMLTKDGCLCRQLIRPVGEPRIQAREWVSVMYDRSYVIERLSNDILDALNFDSLERLLDLIIDVWLQKHNDSNAELKHAENIRQTLNYKNEYRLIDLSDLKQCQLEGEHVCLLFNLIECLESQGFNVVPF